MNDQREQLDGITVGLIGVAVTVAGAALFLRYSIAQFLRFWLARLTYEQQAANRPRRGGDQAELEAIGPGNRGLLPRERRIEAAASNFTRISLMPLMKLERRRRTGPLSSISGMRFASSANITLISARARFAPKQK